MININKKKILILLLLTLSFLSGIFYSHKNENENNFLKFSFNGLNGDKIKILDYDNELFLINFWATWCAPCVEEIPILIDAQKRFSSIRIIGFAFDEIRNARNFQETFKMNYPIIIEENSNFMILNKLGNKESILPFSVLIDRNGNLLESHVGPFNKINLTKMLLNHTNSYKLQ